MILTVKRNGSIKAIDLKHCKILEISNHHIWIVISETVSEGTLLSEKLTEEEMDTLFKFLLSKKSSDAVYDLDELIEAVKVVRDEARDEGLLPQRC